MIDFLVEVRGTSYAPMLFVAMRVSVARDLDTGLAARSEALGGAAMASIIERVTQSAVDQ